MKIGIISEPNKKGQIVIPKKFRDALGITSETPLNLVLRGGGMYVYPITRVMVKTEEEQDLLKVLDRTQGAWGDDKTWDKTEKKRRKIELEASLKRKKAW